MTPPVREGARRAPAASPQLRARGGGGCMVRAARARGRGSARLWRSLSLADPSPRRAEALGLETDAKDRVHRPKLEVSRRCRVHEVGGERRTLCIEQRLFVEDAFER